MNFFLIIFTYIVYTFYCKKYIHIFQLEGYKYLNYFKWIKSNNSKYTLELFSTIINFIVFYLLQFFKVPILITFFTITIFCTAIYIFSFLKSRKIIYKKPLVYTWRVKRLFIAEYIVLTLITILFAYNSIALIFTLIFSWLLAIITIPLSSFLLIPIEKFCGAKYINEAKTIIKNRPDLIVIGITGSYGKTSTKFILQTILSEKYKTYATPDSYNTVYGNVRVIREQLTNLHQIYIAEIGARYTGDVKDVCNIVKPKYGLITSIGNQHLETFKTIDNIIKTKYELINSLPSDGIAFFSDDSSHCLKLYKKETKPKILFGSKSSDIFAKDITTTSSGSTFTIVSKINNTEFVCNTKLLGAHNICNIVGCVAIAQKLGLTNQEIIRGISKISPIAHRLELVQNTNGLNIIDDAFNSNPWGAKAALEVISKFPGKKIIITPGMIELGSAQYDANFTFGKQIASTCDFAILVGKSITLAIQDGLKESKFNLNNMYVVSSLAQATDVLSKIGTIGDTVLFENDLPDNFNE